MLSLHATHIPVFMQEDKSELLRGAMSYGLLMGLYWTIKYIFLMYSAHAAMLGGIYYVLTLLVPFLAYRQTNKYRQDVGGRVGFFHAWQFGVLLYFFAAVVVSLVHYVFYRYVAPPDLLSATMDQMAELYRSRLTPQMLDRMKTMIANPAYMTLIDLLSNTLYGIVLSLPVALAVCRKNGGPMPARGDK